jgi:phosphomannomutase/phosphomannomutase/phosphoglucomutase
MKQSIFRTYDIRGTVGTEFIIDEIEALAHAIGAFFQKNYPAVRTIALGADSRSDSPEIKRRLASVFVTAGFSIIDLGLCPSPLLYFALHTEKIDAGLMITASHNGASDNGIKINVRTAALLPDEIQLIGSYYNTGVRMAKQKEGTLTSRDISDSYVEFLFTQFSFLINSSIALVVDCSNGATGPLLQKIVRAFSWKNVKLLCTKPDGTFPNHDPNPIEEKNMIDVRNTLSSSNFLCGIGIDGDGDRIAVMTKSGTLLAGDELCTIFVAELIKKNQAPLIFCNVLFSDVLIEKMTQEGAEIRMIPVGSPTMRHFLNKENGIFGGETSGHFFFRDRYFGFDDGIYALCRLFEIIQTKLLNLDAYLKLLPIRFTSPECRLPLSAHQIADILQRAQQQFAPSAKEPLLTIDGVRIRFNDGWILLRPSNTQPVLSIRFETTNVKRYSEVQHMIRKLLPEQIAVQFNESTKIASI